MVFLFLNLVAHQNNVVPALLKTTIKSDSVDVDVQKKSDTSNNSEKTEALPNLRPICSRRTMRRKIFVIFLFRLDMLAFFSTIVFCLIFLNFLFNSN